MKEVREAKSLRWLVNMFPLTKIPLDETDKMSNAIHIYCKNAAAPAKPPTTKAVKEFSSHIPPFTEDDILRIKMNSSLSTVAKIKIINEMRKQMKGETE